MGLGVQRERKQHVSTGGDVQPSTLSVTLPPTHPTPTPPHPIYRAFKKKSIFLIIMWSVSLSLRVLESLNVPLQRKSTVLA
jgi:hypothetical protein